MKKCTNCKKDKNNEEFANSKRAKNGLQCWCKGCTSKYQSKPKSEKEKLSTRANYLKHKYKLTHQQVEDMYIKQEGKCAICGVFKSTYNKMGGLYIDHDHETRQV